MRRPRHPRHHFKYFPDLKLVLIVLASWLILLAASSTRPIPSAFGDKAHSPKPADSLVSFSTSTKTKQATQSRVSETFGKLPLYFIENRGQVDARVSYYVQGSDKAIFFTETGLTFVLNGAEPEAGRGGETKAALQPASYSSPSDTAHPAPRTPHSYALKLDFVGARAGGVRPEGEAQTEAVFSYFKGHPSKWIRGLKSYSRVVYRDLWPGIDLVYAGTVNRMKYSFVVRPGADPNQIKLAWRGASEVKLNARGEMEVETPAGGFSDERPVSTQKQEGRQVEVATAYRIEQQSVIGDRPSVIVYGFAVGEYDRSRELVVDPAVLVYAGYIGGSGSDVGFGIAVDSAGNAYVTGTTTSTEASFPDGDGFGALTGPDTTFNGDIDAFVAKISEISITTEADIGVVISPLLGPAQVGSFLTYQITISNLGPEEARGVTLSYTLPSRVTLVDASGTGTCSGNPSVTCSLGTIDPSGYAVVRITVKPLVSGLTIHTASVSADPALTFDPNLFNNSFTRYSTITR